MQPDCPQPATAPLLQPGPGGREARPGAGAGGTDPPGGDVETHGHVPVDPDPNQLNVKDFFFKQLGTWEHGQDVR